MIKLQELHIFPAHGTQPGSRRERCRLDRLKLCSKPWRTRVDSPKLDKCILVTILILMAHDLDLGALSIGVAVRWIFNPSVVFLALSVLSRRLYGLNSTDNHSGYF